MIKSLLRLRTLTLQVQSMLNLLAKYYCIHPPMGFLSPLPLFLMLLVVLPVSVAVSETNQHKELGSSLTAGPGNNSTWKSPSGDFAFGFRQIETGRYLLAIWFDKLPEKTIVWSANGKHLVPQESKLRLTPDGTLRLIDIEGKQIWASTVSRKGEAYYAAMLDTGNLVVANRSHDSILWQSFDHPTDTILPTQMLSPRTELFSRYAERNFSRGRFTLRLNGKGNLALSTEKFPFGTLSKEYWETHPTGLSFLIFNTSGNIYLGAKNESVRSNISSSGVSSTDYYQRAVLEYDGVFRHYACPKNNTRAGWNMSRHIPENICTSLTEDYGGGVCRYNGYCVLGSDTRPQCLCPSGYTYLDPNNHMKGCKQDFVPHVCNRGQDADNFYLQDMTNTDWDGQDYEFYELVEEGWCKEACLTDCFCHAALFYKDTCYKKGTPLTNGVRNRSVKKKALIKIRKNTSTSTSASQKRHQTLIYQVKRFLLSFQYWSLVLLIVILCIVPCLYYRQHKMIRDLKSAKRMNLQRFTYKELEGATNRFKEEIGMGACSTVYKAVLDIGNNNLVAVKRLNKMVGDSEKEYQAEISSIGKTCHRNLVQLLGFCSEGQHRLLVYEYIRNGSLASYLFGLSRPSWYSRTEIAYGTARGLVYLHEECSNRIIHCDIKPHNILLDDSLNPRISDFGIAKLTKMDQTRTITAIRGTKGYFAPEWFKNMPVTVKVDVYSFGILLLELICCRKNFNEDADDESQMVLADWATDCFEQGRVSELVQGDEEAIQDINRVEKYVMIAIWCIQEDPLQRPTMRRVSQMLEEAIDVPLPPKDTHPSARFRSSNAKLSVDTKDLSRID